MEAHVLTVAQVIEGFLDAPQDAQVWVEADGWSAGLGGWRHDAQGNRVVFSPPLQPEEG